MKQLIFSFFVVSFLLISTIVEAQVNISEDNGIATMVQRDKDINKSKTTITGWSVQLMATDDRTEVTNRKGEFISKYPDIRIDWDYENPYYKLRGGAYFTKMQAARLLYLIRVEYPDAYIIQNTLLKPRDFL